MAVGGGACTIIGLVTLPDALSVWKQRVSDVLDIAAGNPLSAGAILIGLILLTVANWNQIGRMLFGEKQIPRWPTDKELGDEIHGWLRHLHWQLRDLGETDIEPSQGALSFGFVATDPVRRSITVVKLRDEPVVRLQAAVKPSSITEAGQTRSHHQIVQEMSKAQKDSMIEEIGLELARTGLGFTAQDFDEGGIQFFSIFVPDESITAAQFMGAVQLISRATLVVQVISRKHIRMADNAVPVLANELPVPQLTSGQEDAHLS